MSKHHPDGNLIHPRMAHNDDTPRAEAESQSFKGPNPATANAVGYRQKTGKRGAGCRMVADIPGNLPVLPLDICLVLRPLIETLARHAANDNVSSRQPEGAKEPAREAASDGESRDDRIV